MNSTTTNTIDEKWINNATTLAKEIADLSKEAYKFIQDKQDPYSWFTHLGKDYISVTKSNALWDRATIFGNCIYEIQD